MRTSSDPTRQRTHLGFGYLLAVWVKPKMDQNSEEATRPKQDAQVLASVWCFRTHERRSEMVNKLYIGCIGCTRESTIPAFVDYPNEAGQPAKMPRFWFRKQAWFLLLGVRGCSRGCGSCPLSLAPIRHFAVRPAASGPCSAPRPARSLSRSLPRNSTQLPSTPLHSPRSRAHGGLPHASMRSDFLAGLMP